MAMTLPITNSGNSDANTASSSEAAPRKPMREAACATGQPSFPAWFTTKGLRRCPTLPPAAMSALAIGPASKCRTAMSSRNVVPAASMMPVAAARRRS